MKSGYRRIPFLTLFLGLVFVLFLGILIFAWVAADRADPVILDETGAPR